MRLTMQNKEKKNKKKKKNESKERKKNGGECFNNISMSASDILCNSERGWRMPRYAWR